MLMSARFHVVSEESVSRLLLWLCKGRWVICGSIITLAQYFRPVPLKRLLWLDELPAVTVDTQQRIQSSRGGTELVLLSENELDKQHSSLGKLPVFFYPSPHHLSFFLAPLARLVFGLMGIILSKRPTVMSEAEHLAFFLPSLHISSQSHLVVHRYRWPCQEVCSSLSTERNVPKASSVVHANHPLCLQGFSLKKQCNVLLSEVLTRAKISATGSLTLEVPGASISDLLGILLFCPSSGLWKLFTVFTKPQGLYNRFSFYRFSLHCYFTDSFGPILAAERKTVIMHAWTEAGISDVSFRYWAVSSSYLWESTADVHYRAVEWQVERGTKASWSGRTPQVFERWRAGDCNWDTEIWNMSDGVCVGVTVTLFQNIVFDCWLLIIMKGRWGLTDQ